MDRTDDDRNAHLANLGKCLVDAKRLMEDISALQSTGLVEDALQRIRACVVMLSIAYYAHNVDDELRGDKDPLIAAASPKRLLHWLLHS